MSNRPKSLTIAKRSSRNVKHAPLSKVTGSARIALKASNRKAA